MNNAPMILSEEIQYALNQLEHSDQHVFISGRAGTGKSTLLQLFRSTSRKRIATVAPTGVAALNIRGQTIHSFFKIPPRLLQKRDITKSKNPKLYKNLEILVIDEISMVRADLFDIVDHHLRVNRGINQPFGGVRLVLFGDLYQLPPVVASQFEKQYLTDTYESPYFFSSHVYQEIIDRTETIELHTVYRQNQKHFIRLLDSIRRKTFDREDLEDLNKRVINPENVEEGSITLTTRNDIVRRINQEELDNIDSAAIIFTAKVNGIFDPRLFPTSLDLHLKVGAQVMLLRNDPQRRYVNGTLGKIVGLSEQEIKVLLYNQDVEETISLEKETWEMIKYSYDDKEKNIKSDVIGSFEQWPINLAWAMTIHKSQGKTFHKIFLDMGSGAFEYGQTYVALSRCTTLEGLQLKRPLMPSDIMTDDRINDFYNLWR